MCTDRTARLFWPGRQTARTTWVAGPLVGVCPAAVVRVLGEELRSFAEPVDHALGECRAVYGHRCPAIGENTQESPPAAGSLPLDCDR